LNFKRPKFLGLMTDVLNSEVDTLVIAHQDRLTRFGFDLVKHICNLNGCTILVLHNEKSSPEQEMVQDLMMIIHGFKFSESANQGINDSVSLLNLKPFVWLEKLPEGS
jgi:putative resolvase